MHVAADLSQGSTNGRCWTHLSAKMLCCSRPGCFLHALFCLHLLLQELGLIGLRIQRMPCEVGVEFNNPATYPYLSVASPSCHDVTPLRAW